MPGGGIQYRKSSRKVFGMFHSLSHRNDNRLTQPDCSDQDKPAILSGGDAALHGCSVKPRCAVSSFVRRPSLTG